MKNVADIARRLAALCTAMSLRPPPISPLPRGQMKTTRAGGGHPDYRVLSDPDGDAPRTAAQQDLWHYNDRAHRWTPGVSYALKAF